MLPGDIGGREGRGYCDDWALGMPEPGCRGVAGERDGMPRAGPLEGGRDEPPPTELFERFRSGRGGIGWYSAVLTHYFIQVIGTVNFFPMQSESMRR